jgi:hypothetical protein
MEPTKVIDMLNEERAELDQELTVIAATKELDVAKALQPEKVNALVVSAELTEDIMRLETQITIMGTQLEAQTKRDKLKEKARELALQLMTEEERSRIYSKHKEEIMEHIQQIKSRYGI